MEPSRTPLLSIKQWFACGAILLFVIGLFAVRIFADSGLAIASGTPLVAPSVETTVLTSPLDSNGDVDYGKAFNAIASKDVTPENNSVVKYLEAFGPSELAPDQINEIFAELGMDPLPLDGDYIEPFTDWLEKHGDVDDSENFMEESDFVLQHMFALNQPWSAEQLPMLDRWLNAMDPKLAIARDGIAREKYYAPTASDYGATNMFTPLRTFARLLSIKSMRHLEAGEINNCIMELESICRIGHHLDQGPTLIDKLVSIMLFSMALNNAETTCSSNRLESHDLQALLKMVDGALVPQSLARKLDVAGRFAALHFAIEFGRRDENTATAWASNKNNMFQRFVDWNAVLRTVNAEIDTLVRLAEIDNFEAFKVANGKNKERLKENAESVESGTIVLGRVARGEMTGRSIVLDAIPLESLKQAECSLRLKKELLRVGIAILIFKNQNGKLPEHLAQLVPQILDRLPNDPMTRQPLTYELTEEGVGFKVYSSHLLNLDNVVDEDEIRKYCFDPKLRTWSEYQQYFETHE